MDCGIPFCHEGCPLGNLIPEWNDLVYRGNWFDALERLHATNNFPEFTGRLCPAPCEGACVLGINAEPVTIERVEYEIAERGWAEGWVTPHVPEQRTGKSVAVVGSGPAGLACAQQLARAGHRVVVVERAERPGGLLRYGIPEFKMEKAVLDRRLGQLRAEGVEFRCSTSVGVAPGERRGDEPGQLRGIATACAPDVAEVARRVPGGRLRRRGPGGGRHAAARPGRARSAPGGRAPGHGVPEAVQPGARRGARHVAHHRPRQARRDHRRRGHRGGLPGHRAPPGCAVGPPARDTAPARPRCGPPTTRGPRGPSCSGRPRPTKRAASGSTR